MTPLSALFLLFTLKLNHRLASWFNFHKIISITLIIHQALTSSALVFTTQHYIPQLSKIINEEAKHLPWGHEISHRLGRTVRVNKSQYTLSRNPTSVQQIALSKFE